MMTDETSHTELHPAGDGDREPPRPLADPACIDSRVLFGPRDEVVIRHGDQLYRLKITRYGKLILNK